MAGKHEMVEVTSRAEWRGWLERRHGQGESIWLVTYKKGDGRHVPYEAIVEEALCFGWVDSLPRKLDDARSMLRLSPRREGSAWSQVNRARVERLIASGAMAPAGMRLVEAARRNGQWSALDAVEALAEPDDLAAALAANPEALRYWSAFPRSAKRAILEWIGGARTDETRARRIVETVEKAAVNIRANQWRQPKSGGVSE